MLILDCVGLQIRHNWWAGLFFVHSLSRICCVCVLRKEGWAGFAILLHWVLGFVIRDILPLPFFRISDAHIQWCRIANPTQLKKLFILNSFSLALPILGWRWRGMLLPFQGVLTITLYPGRCPGLTAHCPFGATNAMRSLPYWQDYIGMQTIHNYNPSQIKEFFHVFTSTGISAFSAFWFTDFPHARQFKQVWLFSLNRKVLRDMENALRWAGLFWALVEQDLQSCSHEY